jgi:perosamine synthetase
MKIPLSNPYIEEKDINAVVEVLKTPNLSLGPKLSEFEEKMASYAGCKYAVAVNSGTSALHLAVKALGLKEGDEVIVPPFTFVASSNCVIFEGAKPVFADVNPETYNLDPKEIEKKITSKTKAIIPVDVFGYPCYKEEINEIAKKHNLKVIEDSAEALGSKENGKMAGTFGDCGIYAFYPNKQITTGEGGMLVTNNKEIYDLAKSIRNQGRSINNEWLDHERLGYNFRLSDINCALGISQLEKIEEIVEKRNKVALKYYDLLKGIDNIKLPPLPKENIRMSWFVFVIQVKNRDLFIEKLREKEIGCSAYFPCVHLMKFYKEKYGYKEGDFPISENISKKTMAIPFHTNLSEKEIKTVCDNIIKINNEINR